MVDYDKSNAREWARKNFIGATGVNLPSYSANFSTINDGAIRHDVALTESFGYASTLLATEVSITPEENARVTALAREVTTKDFGLFFHAAFNSLEENIAAVRLAEQAGADRVLLSYPTSFWPTSEDEIFAYTQAFCDATDLAVMLFPIPLWQFERIHPAGMQVSFVRRILDAMPNVVAIKAEQGFPGIPGLMEMYHHFRDEVVISCPIEADLIPLLSVMDIQYSGTSNTNWLGDWYPKALHLAQNGQWDQAMQSWWKIAPARAAAGQAQASAQTISVLNRTTWKYQEWLAGFNGGALRAPAMRVPNNVMKALRAGLLASDRPVTDLPDSEFMRGRIIS